MPPTPLPDPTRCPLCGAVNGCAMEVARETGAEISTCWCMTSRFDEAVRDRIPVEARGRSCICARCAAGTQA